MSHKTIWYWSCKAMLCTQNLNPNHANRAYKIHLKVPTAWGVCFIFWLTLFVLCNYTDKQCGHSSDCRSSLILVYTVCPKELLKHFSRRQMQTTFVLIGALRVTICFVISCLKKGNITITSGSC